MSKKRIFKIEKNGNYVKIANSFLEVPYLSFKAKALLISLLSRPSNWQLRVNQLVKCSTDGVSSVESGLHELIKYGYIYKERLRDDKGKFKGIDYYVFEDPSLNPYWNKNNELSSNTSSSPEKHQSVKCDHNTNSESQGFESHFQNSLEREESQEGFETSVKPITDIPKTGNQELENPISEKRSYNKPNSNNKTNILKHIHTKVGVEEFICDIRANNQDLYRLKYFQIDQLKDWLYENSDKLTPFTQWFHTDIKCVLSKGSGIDNPAGFTWSQIKKVFSGDISINADYSKTDKDVIDRLKFEVEKPDPNGLKELSNLFNSSEFNDYINQKAHQ